MYKICDSFFSRLKGFMFVKKKLPYGMYFPNCSSIHTFFCFQTLSIYFLDKDKNIIKHLFIKPWKIKKVKGCDSILEFSLNMTDEKKVLAKIKVDY